MDWAVVFGTLGTGVTAAISAIIPIVIPVFVLLAGVGIAFRLFAKAGVRR